MRSRNQSTGENKSLFPDREVRCWQLLELLFQSDFFLCKWQYPVSCSSDKTSRLDNSKDSSKPRFKLIMPGRSQAAGTWRRCHHSQGQGESGYMQAPTWLSPSSFLHSQGPSPRQWHHLLPGLVFPPRFPTDMPKQNLADNPPLRLSSHGIPYCGQWTKKEKITNSGEKYLTKKLSD